MSQLTPNSPFTQLAVTGVQSSHVLASATSRVHLKNLTASAGEVFLKTSTGVTTGNGFPVAAGELVSFAVLPGTALFLISDATATLAVAEEF